MNTAREKGVLAVLTRLHHKAAFGGTKQDADDLATLRATVEELIEAVIAERDARRGHDNKTWLAADVRLVAALARAKGESK